MKDLKICKRKPSVNCSSTCGSCIKPVLSELKKQQRELLRSCVNSSATLAKDFNLKKLAIIQYNNDYQ